MQSAHSIITEREIEMILSLIFCLEEDFSIKYSRIRFLVQLFSQSKRQNNPMDRKSDNYVQLEMPSRQWRSHTRACPGMWPSN